MTLPPDTRRDGVLPAGTAAGTPRRAVSPLALAGVVARNLVPVAAILFFGASAQIALLLCFTETLFAMFVSLFGVLWKYGEGEAEASTGGEVRTWLTAVGIAAPVTCVIALPLAMPLGLFLGTPEGGIRALFDAPALRWGVVAQAAATVSSLVAMRDLVAGRPLQTLRMDLRFGLVLLRWVCVLLLALTPLALAGASGAVLLVAVYACASIAAELAPERFLRAFTGPEDAPSPEGNGKRRRRRRDR